MLEEVLKINGFDDFSYDKNSNLGAHDCMANFLENKGEEIGHSLFFKILKDLALKIIKENLVYLLKENLILDFFELNNFSDLEDHENKEKFELKKLKDLKFSMLYKYFCENN